MDADTIIDTVTVRVNTPFCICLCISIDTMLKRLTKDDVDTKVNVTCERTVWNRHTDFDRNCLVSIYVVCERLSVMQYLARLTRF